MNLNFLYRRLVPSCKFSTYTYKLRWLKDNFSMSTNDEPVSKQPKMASSSLEGLKKHTIVVADTGDFEGQCTLTVTVQAVTL